MLSQIIPSVEGLTTAVKETFVGSITGVTAVIYLSHAISGLEKQVSEQTACAL